MEIVKDKDGRIAVRYFQPTPYFCTVGKQEYVFEVRRSISLAWVLEKDIPGLFAIRGGCCGQQRQAITYASENAVRVWNDQPYK